MTAIDRLTAALSDRYRIERELGQGGMATVYLAHDIKHQRAVAVKVLKTELGAALGAERFLREITTTANLRHPNILPLFDSGEAAGMLYYVMPYVEGETLRDRITREGALPLDDVLRIADEVADALHYAHTRNIIHRDIKPENILLDNEHAIVADFGIAHAFRSAGDDKLTVAGLSLGTPLYMSPEQASGEADARSDLYALGCVMYEMLAGSPPFTATTALAVIMKHALEPVPSLQTVRPDLAVQVAAAVERALAKAATDRFDTLQEFRAAIRVALVSGTAGGTPFVAAIDKPAPRFATSLLGRVEALNAAAVILRDGARVLSVTGYGGTGKTRFAAALQNRVSGDYEGGTAFISLASVTDPADVMSTIGSALDIAEAMGRSAADAVATLIGARRVLLVLDNLEQVVEAAEDIAALVARCDGLQVIATSRRPLRIGAEVELALPPLDVPSSGAGVDAVLASDAVKLFVERAQKARPGFVVTAANADAVAGICRSLDGLPLALELAAARVRILEPAALLQRLDHALDLLTSGDRDLPLRQRTLRATISWSYSLLTPEEQRLLRRLSVFHEGWTLDALERVCYGEDRWRALDDLSSLVEKGLVRVTGSGERYTLLETIRAFGAEQLHAAGEVDAARDAHADYFLALSEEVDAGIRGTTQREAMQRARAENANFFAALARFAGRARLGDAEAVENSMLLCGALGWYWHIAGLHLVAHDVVESMLALANDWPPSRGRARAFFTSGMVSAVTGDLGASIAAWTRMAADGGAIDDKEIEGFGRGGTGYALLGMGRFDEAAAPLNESVRMLEGASSDFLLGAMLSIQGLQRFITGDVEEGMAIVERARRIQIRIGDCEGGGMALSFLAQMHFANGDPARALSLYRESEVDFTTVGDKPELARVYGEMGYVALAASNVVEARHSFQRALRMNDEIGSPRGIGQALFGLAATEAAAGNTARAVTLAAAAHVMSEQAGVVVEHPMAPGQAAQIDAMRASIPSDELAELVEQGRALTPAAALTLATEPR